MIRTFQIHCFCSVESVKCVPPHSVKALALCLLGVLMAIGGIGFVVRNFLLILAPAYASDVLLILMFPGGLIMTVWLLVKGVNVQKWNARVDAASGS